MLPQLRRQQRVRGVPLARGADKQLHHGEVVPTDRQLERSVAVLVLN